MSASVTVFKWFFVWQAAEHGAWLQQQAAQGLQLRSVNALGIHRFERGAAADMVYRWDIPPGPDLAAYRQLYRDAGWEQVAVVAGWCLWRKAARPGQVVEIYTDQASLRRMYQRQALPLAVVLLSSVPAFWANRSFWRALNGDDGAVGVRMQAMLGLGTVVYALCALGLLLICTKIWQIKAGKEGA